MPQVSLSLKARLALITTALAAVLGTGIVLASLYYAHDDLRAALQDQQDSIVKLAADQLDTAMDDRITLLSHVAPQLAGELGRPGAELRLMLEQRIPVPGTFNAFMLADAQGRVLARDSVQVGIADRDYFREAARTLEPVITPPIRARINGATGVLVAVPIVSKQGEFLGLLGGWLDLSSANFLVEITHNRLGTTGFYCLVSGGRMPVYVRHPDPAKATQPARALGDTCGVADHSGRAEFLSPARPLISRYLMESTGWELVAVLPAQEAFAPLHAMQVRFLALALLSLAVVALLIWLTVRHLLTPLTRLHQVVSDSAHDLAAYEKLPAQQRDEIGDLARAFGQLMGDVRERREQLDLSERQLRAVTDTLPALLAFIGPDERYVFNNLAYERTFGITVQALRGMTVREVIGDTRYARARPFLQKALAGSAVTFETEESDPDYHCMETSLRPEWSADGSHVVGVHVHVQDVTQRKLETLRLSRISRLDHLTQLLNRNAFEALLQAAMARSREDGRLMALLYLDMDRFKAVNDFHGHITGDLLLQAFGRRLQRCVRERDTVARLGGDEFAVVLEDIGGAANAQRIAQAIVHSVSRRFFIDGVFADVDVSIGVALYKGTPMPDQELMRQADALLYRAKAAGRGRFEMGPPELLDS
ncbi:sensor domain-containing diguanylate cyclase [Cupriavidus basilensis]|uniref:sensor domain-containing diguanylate cyclase n=1 Tax=Cupriavidus basilensis TaxID=68895 RepID=UPI0020A63B00|nr:diguanylate cyclase [Cupriavidus basilensis]MCP3019220.1 diguanylate cyclase [Cupriavidus basilensis]MDR3381156.1 diguanylate cyclase [Cupriavidus basilensis]